MTSSNQISLDKSKPNWLSFSSLPHDAFTALCFTFFFNNFFICCILERYVNVASFCSIIHYFTVLQKTKTHLFRFLGFTSDVSSWYGHPWNSSLEKMRFTWNSALHDMSFTWRDEFTTRMFFNIVFKQWFFFFFFLNIIKKCIIEQKKKNGYVNG